MKDAREPEAGKCRSCGADIWWRVNEATGKRSPWVKVTVEELEAKGPLERLPAIEEAGFVWRSHFADCPAAAQRRGTGR